MKPLRWLGKGLGKAARAVAGAIVGPPPRIQLPHAPDELTDGQSYRVVWTIDPNTPRQRVASEQVRRVRSG